MSAYSVGWGRGGAVATDGRACPVGVISVASSSESDESYSTRDIILDWDSGSSHLGVGSSRRTR
jgi:hypothetical protein